MIDMNDVFNYRMLKGRFFAIQPPDFLEAGVKLLFEDLLLWIYDIF
jgi:hypothetical protein